MKKILLASTMLVGFAGVAAAEVALSGDARMGILSDFGSDDTIFTSRARVKFEMSGTTDGGLEFGASFRANDAGGLVLDDENGNGVIDADEFSAGGASSGVKGEVFIKGAFGTLSMGDVDGAALAAVGHVDGVGLTGLGDLNESTFIASGADPSVLYEYSTGNLAFYASTAQLGDVSPMALGAKYSTDMFSVALGYEDNDAGTDHIIIGASTTFSNVTLKANYGSASGAIDGDQYAVSATYAADALAATVFYNDNEELGGAEAFGVGASYDLGGGAKVVGGYVKDKTNDEDAFDLGIAMSF